MSLAWSMTLQGSEVSLGYVDSDGHAPRGAVGSTQALTPLSRSMSRKWVARSSRGRRVWGGGVLVPSSSLSASSGPGLRWPSVLRNTRQS